MAGFQIGFWLGLRVTLRVLMFPAVWMLEVDTNTSMALGPVWPSQPVSNSFCWPCDWQSPHLHCISSCICLLSWGWSHSKHKICLFQKGICFSKHVKIPHQENSTPVKVKYKICQFFFSWTLIWKSWALWT